MKKLGLTIVGLSLSGVALADGSAFQNKLTDAEIVSPAQTYQVAKGQADFEIGMNQTTEDTSGAELEKSTQALTGSVVFSAGKTKLGVTAGTSSFTDDSDLDVKQNSVIVTPNASIVVGPVSLGLAVELNHSNSENANDSSKSRTYYRPTLGALYFNNKLEAGAFYTSEVDETGDEDKLNVREAAVYGVHGRFAVTDSVALGLIASQTLESDLVNEADDVQSYVATAELAVAPAIKVSGLVGMEQEGDADTYTVGGGVDYKVSETLAVGGRYEYNTLDEDETEVTGHELGIQMTTMF